MQGFELWHLVLGSSQVTTSLNHYVICSGPKNALFEFFERVASQRPFLIKFLDVLGDVTILKALLQLLTSSVLTWPHAAGHGTAISALPLIEQVRSSRRHFVHLSHMHGKIVRPGEPQGAAITLVRLEVGKQVLSHVLFAFETLVAVIDHTLVWSLVHIPIGLIYYVVVRAKV